MISESEQFARRLAVEVPGLEDLWGVHLMETAGKVLPFIFLLDVSVWAEESAVVAPASVQGLLGLLSEGVESGSAELHDLVVGGFIENLSRSTPLGPLLTPALAAARDRSILGGMSAPD